MDPGNAALLGAGISGIVALAATAIGPLVGHELERRRARQDDLQRFRLSQIDRAERSFQLQLVILEALATREVRRARPFADELKVLGGGDSTVLGDLDALRTFVSAAAPLAARLRYGLPGGIWTWLTALDASHREIQALGDAKVAIHTAFDRQRERVIRDQGLVRLSLADIAEVFDSNPAVQRFRDQWDPPSPQSDAETRQETLVRSRPNSR